MKNNLKFTILFVLTCLMVGCSGSKLSGLYQVKGKITHQGEPIEDVVVNFFPVTASPQARSATGKTDADGTFILTTLQTNDGAFEGEYKITLRKLAFSMTQKEIEEIESDGRSTARFQSKNIIPDHYQTATATPLTFTVKAGKNVCDIDIPEELQKPAFPNWSKYEAQKKK
jgi:5-hydroxyisourate hydrolase-like protein (transthyretin family)